MRERQLTIEESGPEPGGVGPMTVMPQGVDGGVASRGGFSLHEKRLLTAEELSRYLGLPKSTIYTWRCLGKIPGAVYLGRALRFDRGEIDRWVETRKAGVTPLVR